MIFRLSQKLNDKMGAGRLPALPLDENPFADWSATLFTADRTQYILLSNTKSLYSTVLYGKGITNDGLFIDRALSALREFMENDGQAFIYHRFIAPSSATVNFAKALNRSVTGSMNDLLRHAEHWLTDEEISPHDLGFKLNDVFSRRLHRPKLMSMGSQERRSRRCSLGSLRVRESMPRRLNRRPPGECLPDRRRLTRWIPVVS